VLIAATRAARYESVLAVMDELRRRGAEGRPAGEDHAVSAEALPYGGAPTSRRSCLRLFSAALVHLFLAA